MARVSTSEIQDLFIFYEHKNSFRWYYKKRAKKNTYLFIKN